MKILLVGEYSGAYLAFKRLLVEKGHEVIWIHDGDGYKKIGGADFKIEFERYIIKNKILNNLLTIWYLFLDITGVKGIYQIRKSSNLIKSLANFDAVFLINTKSLSSFGNYANLYFFKLLRDQNKKVYLSCLGDDRTWVKTCLEKKYPKLTIFENLSFRNLLYFSWPLLYIYSFGCKKLNNTIINNVNEIIPGLYDYYYSYKLENINCSDILPLVMNSNKDVILENINYPIKVFHGWQPKKELRKGNHIFHKVMLDIEKKYPLLVEYEVVSNLPYDEYVNKFKNCHIFLDQCYSLSSGINGLLAMAEGKVVFTGCDKNYLNYLGVESNCRFCIDALPDEKQLFKDIENIILNPHIITDISANAIKYINEVHSSESVYKKLTQILKLVN